jgi:DNA-binding transcriptional MerR regulator
MRGAEGFCMTEQTYKIGEAAALLNLKSYVLRFWETEFPQLNPLRTESGQRLYSAKDIELLRRICNLLHDRGLTIEGAKKVLSEVQLGDEGLSSDILTEGYTDLFNDLDSDDEPPAQKKQPDNDKLPYREPQTDAMQQASVPLAAPRTSLLASGQNELPAHSTDLPLLQGNESESRQKALLTSVLADLKELQSFIRQAGERVY